MNLGALALAALDVYTKLRARAQQLGEWTPEQEAEHARRFEAGYIEHADAPPPPPGVTP